MNLNTLLNEFIDSLEKEIVKKKKRARNKPIILKDGHKVIKLLDYVKLFPLKEKLLDFQRILMKAKKKPCMCQPVLM